MPKITEVETEIVLIPRRIPLTTSYGTFPSRGSLIVKVHTDEDIVGIGQTGDSSFYSGESIEEMKLIIEKYFSRIVSNQDSFDLVKILDMMDARLPGHSFAKSAVELALWDIMGKSLNVPVYKLLGGKYHEGLRLMGFVPKGTPEKMAEIAKSEINDGYTSVKMKIGIDPKEDLHLYKVVSDAIGDKATIQVDANQGYTLDVAVKTLREMEKYGGLGIVEQPVSRYDLDGMAEVARAIDAPVMADESLFSIYDAIQIVKRNAAEVVLIKIPKQGGINNSKRIAAILEAAGIPLSVACYGSIIGAAAIHFGMSTKSAIYPGPYGDPTDTRAHARGAADTTLKKPLIVENLILKVPDGPGLGVEIDEKKLNKYRIEK